MSFEVEQHWTETFPRITKPEVVGYFSINGQREYLPDLSQLKYINAPRNGRGEGVELNLNHGIDKVIRKPESASEEKINHLLQWIIYNSSQIEAPPGYGRWLVHAIMYSNIHIIISLESSLCLSGFYDFMVI